jgi:TraX protein.
MEIQKTKIKTNLDTGFLKLIGIITMTCDHVGKMLLPDVLILQQIGRIAFPIFAYCIFVGSGYTSNIWKYFLRLLGLAILFQIGYTFYCWPYWQDTFLELNIFFTLAIGLLCIIGIQERKWWIVLIGSFFAYCLNLDYSYVGVLLIVLFYLFRNIPILSLIVVGCHLLFIETGYPLTIGLSMQSLAALSLPLIYIRTKLNFRINKYVFYIFYPVHFIILYLIDVFII